MSTERKFVDNHRGEENLAHQHWEVSEDRSGSGVTVELANGDQDTYVDGQWAGGGGLGTSFTHKYRIVQPAAVLEIICSRVYYNRSEAGHGAPQVRVVAAYSPTSWLRVAGRSFKDELEEQSDAEYYRTVEKHLEERRSATSSESADAEA